MAHPVGRARKSRKAAPPPPPPANSWRAARPVVRVLLTLVGVVGVVMAIAWLGEAAFRQIGPRDRYRVRMADIDCDSPPNTLRETFLTEVRYLGNLPEWFNTHDPLDHQRITEAFGHHPWVESVGEWRLEPGNKVHIDLTFRTPILAVHQTDGTLRLVDANGILVPATQAPEHLPVLVNAVPEPTTGAGEEWNDDIIRRAVDLVQAYQPTRLEKKAMGWRLTQPDGKVLVVQ